MSFEQIDTPSSLSGDDPEYPEEAVAFIQVRSTRYIPVPEGVDPYGDEKPPDAEVAGSGPSWVFGVGAVIPAHLLPDRVWRHSYDSLLAVDTDGEPVSHGRDSYQKPKLNDAEKALRRFQKALESGEGLPPLDTTAGDSDDDASADDAEGGD